MGRGTESFGEAYASNFTRVFWFIAARVADTDAARDLAQEVFVRYYKICRSEKSVEAAVSTYLFGIARHVVADHRSGRDPLDRGMSLEALAGIPADGGPDPVDTAALRRCLDRLGPTGRAIVVSRFWRGERHGEIARRLGTSEALVRQRFRRALLRLRRCLGLV